MNCTVTAAAVVVVVVEFRFASKRFFNRLLSQAGLADTIGPPPSSMVIDVESLWIEFAFDSVR